MEKILIGLGIIFLVAVILIFVSGTIKAIKVSKNEKLGKLYFKQWPNGSRTFHLNLDVDLEEVREGEIYTITVKEEKPTEAELEVIREVSEE